MIFNMMQAQPMRPHRQFLVNQEVVPVAQHILSPYNSLSKAKQILVTESNGSWLVYLQKITKHPEPFMPALMKASTYITIHYRNGIHA
jgi:hypothetical protein